MATSHPPPRKAPDMDLSATAAPLLPAVVACLALLIALPEALLILADHGILGTARWRGLCYGYGAFWPGLLHGWQANFPGQRVAMFLSYSFLHADLWHLLGNLAGLVWLGRIAVGRVGQGGMAALYALSVLGGAAAFGWLSDGPAPMVGASGGLFGLAGAWVVWGAADDLRPLSAGGRGRRRALIEGGRIVALLVAANIASLKLTGGHLAWQTHLGGFLAGALGALALLPRRRGTV